VTSLRRPWLLFGPAAIAAGGLGVALTLTSNHEDHPLRTIALGLFVGWSFVFAGLVGWTRRPDARTGMLMVAVGFGIFVGSLSEANQSVPFTIGWTWGGAFIAIFLHLLLAYPSGRLESRLERAVVAAGYAAAILAPLLATMFEPNPDCGTKSCPANAFLVSRSETAHDVAAGIAIISGLAVLLAVLRLLVRRWRGATPALRRTLRPVYLAGGLSLALFVLALATTPLGGSTSTIVFVLLLVTFTSIPFIFLGGLLRATLARGVDKIFREIPERASPAEVQGGLRQTLRDPTLEIAFWYDEGGHYVDVEGNRYDLPDETSARVVTRLDYADTRVGALVHDAALREEPELLESIAGAARIAMERDKLQVEVRARAERYRALLQAMPDLMFRISRDGTYLAYNAPNERDLFIKDVVGLTVWDRLPRNLAHRVLEAGRAALDSGEAQVIEYALDFGGQTRHYEGRFAASGEDEFLMIVREITERKRQQEELEASRARIVAAGDEARRKLERNLHDGAQQRLVSLALSLRLAQAQLRRDPAAAEQLLEGSREELSQALEELRELARGIHPAVLTDRGLESALDALAARAPLPVTIEGPDGVFPAPVDAAVYYVVSEALANVTKYAEASSVKVTVARENGYALVEVEDDGVGGADPARGSGLRGLEDRLSSLRGTLEINSPPGSGTRIRARIPLGVGSDA
jgi:PAS domain S-box-containing protein